MSTTTATKRKRKQTIEQYRQERFEGMGFTIDHATRLAYAKDHNGLLVDTHQVAKMLDNGCTNDLVIQIMT